jgi:hypothetical protein
LAEWLVGQARRLAGGLHGAFRWSGAHLPGWGCFKSTTPDWSISSPHTQPSQILFQASTDKRRPVNPRSHKNLEVFSALSDEDTHNGAQEAPRLAMRWLGDARHHQGSRRFSLLLSWTFAKALDGRSAVVVVGCRHRQPTHDAPSDIPSLAHILETKNVRRDMNLFVTNLGTFLSC